MAPFSDLWQGHDGELRIFGGPDFHFFFVMVVAVRTTILQVGFQRLQDLLWTI